MSFILHFYVFNTCCEPTMAQRLMEKIVAGLQLEIFVIYLEDVNILGKTFEDIIKNPIPIFDRLLEADLKLKARKCTLFATEVGHAIPDIGNATDPAKVQKFKG